MASPQPTDAHGIIAHDIQENLITRNFTEQQLKIIYLIIRLSWGCGLKAWQYNSYRDFEAIGIYKSDIAGHLKYLANNRVIDWVEKYNLLIFNKDYDEWKIPINKKSSPGSMDILVHESLKNSNDVRELLTVLGKIPNGVRKFPERSETETSTAAKDIKLPKESIKESINIYTPDFEKFYSLYPNPQNKQQSFKNWKTCLKKHSVEELLKASENYKNSVEGRDRQYIKTSSNFLGRDKFYIDYLPENYKEVEQLKTRGW